MYGEKLMQPEGRRNLQVARLEMSAILKLVFKYECGPDSSASGQVQVAGICDNANEILGSTIVREFPNYLTDYWHFMKDSASWSFEPYCYSI